MLSMSCVVCALASSSKMKGVLLLIKLPDILIIKKCLEYVSKQGRTFSMSSVDLSACNIFSSCLVDDNFNWC